MNVDKRGTGEVGWDCGPGGGVGRLGGGEGGRVPFLREKAAGSGPAGPAGDLPPSEAALTHVGNSRRHRHSTSAKLVLHIVRVSGVGKGGCLLCATGMRGKGGVSQGGPGL